MRRTLRTKSRPANRSSARLDRRRRMQRAATVHVFQEADRFAQPATGRQQARQRFILVQLVDAVGDRARDVARFAAVAVVERVVDADRFPKRNVAGADAVLEGGRRRGVLVPRHQTEYETHAAPLSIEKIWAPMLPRPEKSR